MNLRTLVSRSLLYHRRGHTGTLIGTALTAAILVGALAVGDCVRGSLREHAAARIGRATHVLQAGDRFFRSALADDLRQFNATTTIAPVLALGGAANTPDNSTRANNVRIYGVDDRFFSLALNNKSPFTLAPGDVAIGRALAHRLNIAVGDALILRTENPGGTPREAVLARADDTTLGLRVTVKAIVDAASFGEFSPHATQLPPLNAYVQLDWLGESLDMAGRANMLLADGYRDDAQADDAINATWQLADAELSLHECDTGSMAELSSHRIFIDPAVAAAIDRTGYDTMRILTYFATSIEAGERNTPYSIVSAVEGPGADTLAVEPGDIVINEWLADDLQVSPGDTLALRYYVFDESQHLVEETATFRVARVIPIDGLAADRTLMPEFPGIADAEDSRDWEPGIPIDLDRIRTKDEDYWDTHRGTPKAFINLKIAQDLWGSRFGRLTAVRVSAADASAFAAAVHEQLDPANVGLTFTDLRSRAHQGSATANDFGMLFLSLSAFLIISAVLLTTLLFIFTIERRAREIGTLLAIGYRPRTVRRLLVSEAALLAIVGAIVGIALGLAYTRVVLHLLTSVWSGATGSLQLSFHVTAMSIVVGAAVAAGMSIVTTWLAVRFHTRRDAVDLLHERPATRRTRAAGARRGRIWLIAGSACAIVGVLIMLAVLIVADRAAAAPGFFAAGALLLCATVLLSAGALRRGTKGAQEAIRLSLHGLAARSACRRPGRSLATILLLACGVFLVVAVGLNRLDATVDATARDSGTGGFELFATTTIPLARDPADTAARQTYGLDDPVFAELSFVSMRVQPGDDASCLNLGTAVAPQLVGVRATQLAELGAFSFVHVLQESPDNPWNLLTQPQPDGAIPAIGDHQSVTWALHRSVGDTITYTNARGDSFDVRIVATVRNSLLQGNLFIDESMFTGQFPDTTGYRMFLIDTPPDQLDSHAVALSRQFADVGMEVTQAVDRLNAFNAVQNAYLSIFQMLGGLGLLLGVAGLAVVVARNVNDRRGELAALTAVGYRRSAVRRLVLLEHARLLAIGVLGGTASAVVAVIPALREGSSGLDSIATTTVLVMLLAIAGVAWIWLATWLSLRGRILAHLRVE